MIFEQQRETQTISLLAEIIATKVTLSLLPMLCVERSQSFKFMESIWIVCLALNLVLIGVVIVVVVVVVVVEVIVVVRVYYRPYFLFVTDRVALSRYPLPFKMPCGKSLCEATHHSSSLVLYLLSLYLSLPSLYRSTSFYLPPSRLSL